MVDIDEALVDAGLAADTPSGTGSEGVLARLLTRFQGSGGGEGGAAPAAVAAADADPDYEDCSSEEDDSTDPDFRYSLAG